jgi:hypothetical protein
MNEKEQYWIAFYQSLAPKGYNLTSGGENGRIVAQETKDRLSEFMTGKTGKDHPGYGHTMSEEKRLAQSERMKNRIVSSETIAKMSIASKLKKNNIKKCLIIKDNIGYKFDSFKEAARFLGCSNSRLCQVYKRQNGIHSNYTVKEI